MQRALLLLALALAAALAATASAARTLISVPANTTVALELADVGAAFVDLRANVTLATASAATVLVALTGDSGGGAAALCGPHTDGLATADAVARAAARFVHGGGLVAVDVSGAAGCASARDGLVVPFIGAPAAADTMAALVGARAASTPAPFAGVRMLWATDAAAAAAGTYACLGATSADGRYAARAQCGGATSADAVTGVATAAADVGALAWNASSAAYDIAELRGANLSALLLPENASLTLAIAANYTLPGVQITRVVATQCTFALVDAPRVAGAAAPPLAGTSYSAPTACADRPFVLRVGTRRALDGRMLAHAEVDVDGARVAAWTEVPFAAAPVATHTVRAALDGAPLVLTQGTAVPAGAVSLRVAHAARSPLRPSAVAINGTVDYNAFNASAPASTGGVTASFHVDPATLPAGTQCTIDVGAIVQCVLVWNRTNATETGAAQASFDASQQSFEPNTTRADLVGCLDATLDSAVVGYVASYDVVPVSLRGAITDQLDGAVTAALSGTHDGWIDVQVAPVPMHTAGHVLGLSVLLRVVCTNASAAAGGARAGRAVAPLFGAGTSAAAVSDASVAVHSFSIPVPACATALDGDTGLCRAAPSSPSWAPLIVLAALAGAAFVVGVGVAVPCCRARCRRRRGVIRDEGYGVLEESGVMIA